MWKWYPLHRNPTWDEREHREAPATALVSPSHWNVRSSRHYIKWTWTWTTIKKHLDPAEGVNNAESLSDYVTDSWLGTSSSLTSVSADGNFPIHERKWSHPFFFLLLVFNFEVRHQRPGPVCRSVRPPRSSASTPFMNSLTATVDHSETNYWGESEGAEIEPAWIQIQQSRRPVAKLLLLGRSKNVWGI